MARQVRSISIPEDLHAQVKASPDISVSSVAQYALRAKLRRDEILGERRHLGPQPDLSTAVSFLWGADLVAASKSLMCDLPDLEDWLSGGGCPKGWPIRSPSRRTWCNSNPFSPTIVVRLPCPSGLLWS